MKLTDTFLRGLKTTGKVQKHSDGGGLYLHVSPVGGKLWRLGYRFQGKQKLLSLGPYPAISLKDARALREDAKAKLAAGIDPCAHKQAVKASTKAENENSYEVVAREWHAKHAPGWSESNGERTLTRQVNDIFPVLGNRPISQITAPELLAVLRKIESRGAIDTAHRTLQDCSRVFRYAIATGRAERDPASDLRGALPPARSTSFASITDPVKIGALLRDIDAYSGNMVVCTALKMAPCVFVRPGELRRAEWSEFNLDSAEWRIPGEKMKMKVQHIVPLSRQVLELLHELHQYTGDSPYLFPSMRANSAPISDMTLLAGLRRLVSSCKNFVQNLSTVCP